MLRASPQPEQKGLLDRLTALYTGNLAFVVSGIAVLTVAPLVGSMIASQTGGGAAGALLGEPGYEESLLDTLVGKAFGWLLHGESRIVPAQGVSASPFADAQRAAQAGTDSWRKGSGASPWQDAIDSAAKGIAKADKSAGLPKPNGALANKLSWLASTKTAAPTTGAGLAHPLSPPSSKGLVKDPHVESNLSRLEGKDFSAAGRFSGAGLVSNDGRSAMTTAAQLNKGVDQQTRVLSGSEAGPVNAGNNAIDPQIKKLNEINAKWDATVKADEAAIKAIESSISGSQSTWDLVKPMTELGALEAKLAADEAAHMAEVQAWNDFVGMKWPGSGVNAFKAMSTQHVMHGFHGAHGHMGHAQHHGGQAYGHHHSNEASHGQASAPQSGGGKGK